MQLRIAGIVEESVVDGPGMRLAVFSQGCFHACKGCHNPQTHDPKGGSLVDIEEIAEMARENPLLSGITFSGGEPFLQARAFAALADLVKPDLDIVCYTGYVYEKLLADKKFRPLLEKVDVLVDGPFIEAKKDCELLFRGSSNQRAIDVHQSLRFSKVVPAWEKHSPRTFFSPR